MERTEHRDVTREDRRDPVADDRVGRYRLVRRLGRGGLGIVYMAKDEALDRIVALKILRQDRRTPEAARRFRREARLTAALHHPGVCAIHDLGEHSGCAYIVMEYLEGESLRRRLAEERPGLSGAVAICREVAGALGAAHARDLVHRDVKPENVMLTRRGVRLLDFGVATRSAIRDPAGAPSPAGGRSGDLPRLRPAGCALDSRVRRADLETELEPAGTVTGTIGYMSPEQARGEPVDASSDVFSLGVLLFEMVSGLHPLAGGRAAEVFDRIHEGRAPRPSTHVADAPPALDEVVLRALAGEPTDRYPSGSEFERALAGLWSAPGAVAWPPASGVPARPAVPRIAARA